MGLFNFLKKRKALFRWHSERDSGILKIEFRGAFCQANARVFAIKELDSKLAECDVILAVDFVGIEE
jgi:hypothetical protein